MSDADSIMHHIRTAKPGAKGLVLGADWFRMGNLFGECLSASGPDARATIHNRTITLPNGSTARFIVGTYDNVMGLSPDWVVYVGHVDDRAQWYLDRMVKRRAEAK